jgi:hypothetical protein
MRNLLAKRTHLCGPNSTPVRAPHHQHWLAGQEKCIFLRFFSRRALNRRFSPARVMASMASSANVPRNKGGIQMKIALCFAALISLSAPTLAGAFAPAPADGITGRYSEPVRAKRKVIDKSCLMICENWGENDCEKWVMKCKGDKGYPKAILLRQ